MANNLPTKINIGVVGLGAFARPFIRCYQRHPLIGKVAVCARNPESLNRKADILGIDPELRFSNYEEMLRQADIDAIHIISPNFDHYKQEILALKAGKHVAVAVSMGETIQELTEIVRLRRESNKTFMLMDTSAYSRDILRAKSLIESGALGHVQFIHGCHMADPGSVLTDERWIGHPPLLYGAHAAVPLYVLTGKLAKSVVCLGSGFISEGLNTSYNCTDACQTALVSLHDSDVTGLLYKATSGVIREFRESFDVYGSKMSYEWEQVNGEGATVHFSDGRVQRAHAPDVTASLPDSLIYKGPITEDYWNWLQYPIDTDEYALRLGHYGAYPHLVHEFVSACVEKRDSYLDAEVAANITAVGILAVESARQGGTWQIIPDFSIH